MSAEKKMSRLVQIGLSRSEKAKMLANRGFYEDALGELAVALDSFRQENEGGIWDDSIAGVLNNMGLLYLFLLRFDEANAVFTEALAIKEKLAVPIFSTLIGLSDAYRGRCDFGRAQVCLERAMDETLTHNDESLSILAMQKMELLEKTRDNLPAEPETSDHGILMLPSKMKDIEAVIPKLSINVDWSGHIIFDMVIGFPGLHEDIEKPAPCMSVLFPSIDLISLKSIVLSDEECGPTQPGTTLFKGNIFSSNSYHPHGPLPIPSCKKYSHVSGEGWVFSWKMEANGWYKVTATINVGNEERLTALLLLPFGRLRLSEIRVTNKKSVMYRKTRITTASYVETGERPAPADGLFSRYSRKSILLDSVSSGLHSVKVNKAVDAPGILIELFNPEPF